MKKKTIYQQPRTVVLFVSEDERLMDVSVDTEKDVDPTEVDPEEGGAAKMWNHTSVWD